jgi:hypothetical protein
MDGQSFPPLIPLQVIADGIWRRFRQVKSILALKFPAILLSVALVTPS